MSDSSLLALASVLPPADSSDWNIGNWTECSTFLCNWTLTTNDTETFPDELNATINGTEKSSLPERNQFILPIWEQALWAFLFAGMVMVATGGNLIVIWIVLAHKRMRTVTNYFIVNLSVADTMVSTLNVIFSFSYLINSHWPFGYTYCKICSFVSVLSVSGSVFTLMAISLDRYWAIMKPLKPRMGRRMTLGIIVLIWTISTSISLPMFIFSETKQINLKNGDVRVLCIQHWPDGNPSHLGYWYNMGFMLLTYFIPIGVMIAAYALVGAELWGSQTIGECTQRQMESIHSKRKVVKMMIFIVATFAVCWLPYHVYFILESIDKTLGELSFAQELFLGLFWLAMSNSMYNPMIYCWMNQRFRRGFKIVFRFCPGISIDTSDLDARSCYTVRYSTYHAVNGHRINTAADHGNAAGPGGVTANLLTRCHSKAGSVGTSSSTHTIQSHQNVVRWNDRNNQTNAVV